MDVAYNQHSPHFRHHSRSSTSLNHLTLAPLTSRLPISEPDELEPPETNRSSYIEGRSAPTTPSILSRSSSRVSLKKPAHITLPKSKSSTHLIASRQARNGPTTPGATRLRHAVNRDELAFSSLSAKDRNDSDWLLRTSASISTSTRESKGQAWLVSRASSTSLTGQQDEDDEQFERTLAREREQNSRRVSRRGSITTVDADDEFSPVTTKRSLSFGPPTGIRSRPMSRFNSQNNSRRGSRAHLFNAVKGDREGYFDQGDLDQVDFMTEPDFVNDEEEEPYEDEEGSKYDQDIVRKLAWANSNGLGGWVEKMLGWSLFAVEEDGEGDDTEVDEKGEISDISSKRGGTFDGPPDQVLSDMPVLKDDQTGGWQDAAWLLSVATKVLL